MFSKQIFKFRVYHQQWWLLHKSEIFSIGTENNIKTQPTLYKWIQVQIFCTCTYLERGPGSAWGPCWYRGQPPYSGQSDTPVLVFWPDTAEQFHPEWTGDVLLHPHPEHQLQWKGIIFSLRTWNQFQIQFLV